jgi:NHS family xanthosine MFS transporter
MIKLRLTTLSFLQFFIWGCWLITIGSYCFNTKHWSPGDFGVIFSTMGISALFMPPIAGILADRLINAEKLYGILHLLGGICLFFIPNAQTPDQMFWSILITMVFYMPTISLSNTVAYSILSNHNLDIVKSFPPIRVWGTIGFIVALWIVSLTENETSAFQFYLASAVSIALSVYAFTLPSCPPMGKKSESKSLSNRLGLDAFKLFKKSHFAIFFIFAMLLGAALQLTNAYGDTFLQDFKFQDQYKNLLSVKYPAIIMSISQISETLFILTIPFFMKRFGIKQVMIFSMVAWVLRFALFAYGDPGSGLWLIVLSCIIYGMAFDFFTISGSLFIETSINQGIRSSAQGLFTMMVNGVGAVLGSLISGKVIELYFTENNVKNWHDIWLAFAAYAAVVTIFFVILFKEEPKKIEPSI